LKNSRLKIDLHVHTCYSEDALTTPEEVVYYARKKGLDGVAITDHETLKKA
jgi:predicted metal-dependent phosphoesterase TrpH